MSDLTPAYLADLVHRHEANLHVVKLLVADLISNLPEERQSRVAAFLHSLDVNAQSMLDVPRGLTDEVTLDHLKAAIAEMRSLIVMRQT